MRNFRFPQSVFRDLLEIINAAAFAMVLSYFLWRWMGTADVPVATFAVSFFIAALFWKWYFRFWKISFPLTLLVLFIAWVTWPEGAVSAESPFLWRKAAEVYRAVEWALHWNHLKGPMPVAYPWVLRWITAFLATVAMGRRAFAPLLIALLVTPLFFLPEIGADPAWKNWFFVGLACILFAWTQPRTLSLPPLVPLAAVLVATLFLSAIIPPQAVFSEALYTRLRPEQRAQDALGKSSFSLAEAGFPETSVSVGGPILLSKEPFLVVNGGPDSFYLRGSAYTQFEDHRWTAPPFEPSEPFVSPNDPDGSVTNAQWDALLGSPSVRSTMPDFSPSTSYNILAANDWFTRDFIIQQPLQGHRQTVFLPGPTFDVFSLDAIDVFGSTLRYSSEKEPHKFRWNDAGLVMSEEPIESAVVVSGWAQSPSQSQAALGSMLESGFVPLRAEAPRRYESLVREKDPGLHRIVYESLPASLDEPARIGIVLNELRQYIQDHYRYSLEVPPVPSDRSLLSWLLDNREGYCVYYGTLGAVMLQDIGVEARYAEGFLVPAVPTAISSTERTVTGESGHAWTEISLQGFGWVIFDITPSSHLTSLSQGDAESDPPSGAGEENTEFDDERRPDRPRTEPTDPIEPIATEAPQRTGLRSVPQEWLTGLAVSASVVAVWIWRRSVFRRRHDPTRFRKRWIRRPNALVRTIWRDLLRMHDLVLPAAQPQASPRTILMAFAREVYIKDIELLSETIALVERSLYSSQPTPFDSLDALLTFYDLAERKLAAQLPKPKWWLARWLLGPRPPV